MAAPRITEVSGEDIAVRNSRNVWRPVGVNLNVPDSFSGKFVSTVAVVTDVDLTDAQETALANAIEAIAGVTFAKVVIGSSRLSLDRLPPDTVDTDYQLRVKYEMALDGVAVTP